MAVGVTIDVNASVARFTSGINKATGDLNKFQSNASRMGGNLKGVFAQLAPALSVAGLVALAQSSINAADAFSKMEQRTGVAVATLAGWKLAADSADTSLDTLAKGIQKLTLSVSEAQGGDKEKEKSLKALGITSTDAKVRFEQLADAVAKESDLTKINIHLKNVQGKSFVDLLPLLQGGSKGLRDSADASQSFTDAMVKMAPNAVKFNDSLTSAKSNAAGLGATIISNLLPSLSEYIGALDKILRRGTLMDKIKFFTIGFMSAEVLDEVGDLGERISITTEGIKALKKELAAESGLDFAGLPSLRAADLIKEIAVAQAALDALEKRQAAIVAKPPPKTPGTITIPGEDPLKSLLGQTDTAKLAEFDKFTALISERMKTDPANIQKYAEASTLLQKSFFAGDLKKEAEFLAAREKEALVNLGLKREASIALDLAQQDLNQARVDGLKALLDATPTAMIERQREAMKLLADEFLAGRISETLYLEAVTARLDLVAEKLPELSSFAKTAAENIQGALADFLFDPFKDGLDGMLKGFGNMVKRMVAEAAAADIAKSLFGSLIKGGTGSGLIGAAFSSIFGFADGGHVKSQGISAYSGSVVSKPTLFPFAHGIGLMGEAGAEAILPLKRGSDGKLGVSSGGGQSVVINISNVIGNVASQTDVIQGMQVVRGQILQQLSRGQRYGGSFA